MPLPTNPSHAYILPELLKYATYIAGDDGLNRFYCSTCPYEFKINGLQMYDRKKLNRKEVDDVLGGEVPGIMSIKLQLSVR